jgi:hypothetical protein
MSFATLILLLLVSFTSSVLLVSRFLLPAKPTVAGIGLFVFWLCTLIVPVHCLALLNLFTQLPFPRVSHLFFLNGIILACALALGVPRVRRRGKSDWIEAARQPRLKVPVHVALGLLIVVGVYGIQCARMAFTFPDAWDAVVYHYPVALRWLQEGTMRITSTTAWPASLPGNVELLDLLVLWTRCERLLGSVQWLGVFILLLASLHLSRRLSRSVTPEWPVVTTILMIPMVATQSMSGYVDLFGTALLFGSLTLVLEYSDQLADPQGTQRPAWLVAAGLACGLAVGTKPVFWLFAALLFLNAVFLLLFPGGKPSQRGWWHLLVFLSGVALPSFLWFARATVCTSNPFYPVSLRVGSLLLPGVPPSSITEPNFYLSSVRHWAELFVYPWTEWKRYPGFLLNNYGVGDGLGAGFATFVMPGVFFAGWLAKRRRPDLRVWLVNLTILGILWWFLLQKVVRFALPIFILAVVLSAPFFEILETRATNLYRFLYVLVFTITGGILVFEPLYTVVQTARDGHWSRAEYWQYPAAIDELRPGSRILSLCEPTLNFALAGRGLTNRVIPSWERPDRLTADFLRSHQVDYVVQESLREKDDARVDTGPPLEGLEPYFSSSVRKGDKVTEWRIWSTGRFRNDSPGPIPPPSVR